MGTLLPTSKVAANLVAQEVLKVAKDSEGFVVELGSGTGRITAALLKQGIHSDRLICVELDPELHKYMTGQFPNLNIFLGDAAELKNILGKKFGKVAVIVSSLPMTLLPLEKRRKIELICFSSLKSGGIIIQLCYSLKATFSSPFLSRELKDYIIMSLPPAFIWAYKKE